MKILVILGHPGAASFNHAIAEAVRDELSGLDHEVIFHDLCRENFPPLLPETEIGRIEKLDPVVAQHCRELAEADGIVIIHPNWWGMPPAVVTGWVDRVFRPGVAYCFEVGDGGEGVPVGVLKAKAAVIFNTSNTPAERERRVFGDPLELIWRRCIFELCGVTDFHRKMFSVVITSTGAERAGWLDEARSLCRRVFSR